MNCSSDLKNFANSCPSASNFKSFSRSLEHIFLAEGQNNFCNKIPSLNDYCFTRAGLQGKFLECETNCFISDPDPFNGKTIIIYDDFILIKLHTIIMVIIRSADCLGLDGQLNRGFEAIKLHFVDIFLLQFIQYVGVVQ